MSQDDAPAPRERPRSSRPTRAPKRRGGFSLARLRPRVGTLVAVALASVTAVLAWADPFAKPEDSVLLVNNRSGGRRVFPTLVDADPAKATIELQAPDGPVVRVVPAPDGGHRLMHGDTMLGPVAAEDFEGLWSSLRLATAQRTAKRNVRAGHAGVIRISLPDQNLMLSLGDPVVGGGVYGVFEADGDTWVVETEMLTLVQQPPRSWLSKRLLAIDVALVTGLAWGDELALGRSDDGFWRIRSGAQPAILSTEAVELRLRRLLRATLDPFVEREAVASESLHPHLVVTTLDGRTWALNVGGECPGHPRKRLVERGPGLLGCIPAELLERWPLLDPEAGMLAERLVPHDYARIVGVDLEGPAPRKLMRRGGEWFFSGEDGTVESVAEEEVRRWYQALGQLEVAREPDAPPPDPDAKPEDAPPSRPAFEIDWEIVVHADTHEQLRVRCRLSVDPVVCIRDEGPVLRVLGELPQNLAFTAETFAARRLTEIGPGEIRELEILPPLGFESAVVRQSVHADLGSWRLDAPAHPDDSGAIDEVRLETVLWALRGLRAESWVERPAVAPLRRLVVEIVPERGKRYALEVDLYPDCVVEVSGLRPALVADAQCEALGQDLMFDDPLRFLLERARGVEVASADGDTQVFLRRRDEQFVTSEGAALDDEQLEARLQRWIDWRAGGISAGEPPSPVAWRLDVRRDFGPGVQLEVGEGWARVRGADWYYVEREPEAEVPDVAPEPETPLDPGAVEIDDPRAN